MKTYKLESQFQSQLVKKLKQRFPGCIVLKNDPTYMKGVPDILVLYNDRWAMLECKLHENSTHQSLQDYFVEKLNDMSYATFIFPENEEEVLDDLQRSFEA